MSWRWGVTRATKQQIVAHAPNLPDATFTLFTWRRIAVVIQRRRRHDRNVDVL